MAWVLRRWKQPLRCLVRDLRVSARTERGPSARVIGGEVGVVACCPDSKSMTVMVADADPLTRWSLSHYLGRWVEVRTAENLSEARALLRCLNPAVVIVGDEFPDGGGEELTSEVRESRPQAQVIRISINGEADPGGDNPTIRGIERIEKPFALARIAAMIGLNPT